MARVALAGKSDVARIMIDLASQQKIEVVAILDQTPEISSFAGVSVVDRSAIDSLMCDAIVITDLDDSEAVEEDLKRRGIPEERIWSLS